MLESVSANGLLEDFYEGLKVSFEGFLCGFKGSFQGFSSIWGVWLCMLGLLRWKMFESLYNTYIESKVPATLQKNPKALNPHP